MNIRRILKKLNWKYRKVDPQLCCCGCNIGQGGSICHHGGCRSAKEYAITSELKSEIKISVSRKASKGIDHSPDNEGHRNRK